MIFGANQRREFGQDVRRLKVGNHAKESYEAPGVSRRLFCKSGGHIVRGSQITDEGKTIFLRHDGRRLPRDQNHRGADIARRVEDLFAARFQ